MMTVSDASTSTATKRYFTQAMAILGTVSQVDTANGSFVVRCRSGEEFRAQAKRETFFTALKNMDDLNYDRIPNPRDYDPSKPSDRVRKYVREGEMLFIEGVDIEHDGVERFDAQKVTLLTGNQDQYLFEDTHWWLTQIARFADQWLDDLFEDRRSYEWDDFAKLYRTNLNILGQPT